MRVNIQRPSPIDFALDLDGHERSKTLPFAQVGRLDPDESLPNKQIISLKESVQSGAQKRLQVDVTSKQLRECDGRTLQFLGNGIVHVDSDPRDDPLKGFTAKACLHHDPRELFSIQEDVIGPLEFVRRWIGFPNSFENAQCRGQWKRRKIFEG